MFELSYSTSGDEAVRTLTAADRLPVWQAQVWQVPAEAVNYLKGVMTPRPKGRGFSGLQAPSLARSR